MTLSVKRIAAVLNNPPIDHGISLNYGAVACPTQSVVESAVHELAHAVVLRFPLRARGWSADLTDRIDDAIKTQWWEASGWRHAGEWQEIMTLAAERHVLRALNLRCWNMVTLGAAHRDGFDPELVYRNERAPISRVRAQRVLGLLERIQREDL